MNQEDLQAQDYDSLLEVWRHEVRCLNTATTAEVAARWEKHFYQGRVSKVEAEMARRKRETEEEEEG